MKKIIYQGAEAIIEKSGDKIIKSRISKGYRIPALDGKIRKLRTRSEARIITKANSIIPSPKIVSSDENAKKIEMEFISGKRLSDCLEKLNYIRICKQIGKSLAKLHDSGLMHGDLTTSNLIYNEKLGKVYFIDFGLGFHSSRAEDKAVDLHLIKEALEARHPRINEKAYKAILSGYKSSKNYSSTIRQLEKVEKRGRYKAHY